MAQVQKAISGRQLHIPLNAKIEIGKLLARVYNETDEHVKDAEIEEKSFGEYIIKFKPKEAGTYKMEILVAGDIKRTVTIIAEPAPVARLLGSPKLSTYVGQEVEFEIECPAGVKVEHIVGRFRKVAEDDGFASEEEEVENTEEFGKTTIKNISETKFALQFCPKIPGVYHANVGILGQGPMAGELTVEALDLPAITLLMGDSTTLVGQPYCWKLKHNNVPVKQLQVVVSNPNGTESKAHVVDNMDGTLDVVYTPQLPGTYTAKLRLESGEFSNQLRMQAQNELPKVIQYVPPTEQNPRQVDKEITPRPRPAVPGKALEPTLQSVNYYKEILSGDPFEMHLKTSDVTQDNHLFAIIKDSKGETVFQRDLLATTNGTYDFDFLWKGTRPGRYHVQVYLDNAPFGSSIPFMVLDNAPRKAEYSGKNVSTGRVGAPFVVVLDLSSMNKQIQAPVRDSGGNIIDHATVEIEDNVYKLTFIPKQPGEYTLSLVIDGTPVDNSAAFFKVTE